MSLSDKPWLDFLGGRPHLDPGLDSLLEHFYNFLVNKVIKPPCPYDCVTDIRLCNSCSRNKYVSDKYAPPSEEKVKK